jgi:hypothetical protein
MTDTVTHNGLAIVALRHTLTKVMVDATTACKELENRNPRVAVGALFHISQALDDARGLLDTIFILNRILS